MRSAIAVLAVTLLLPGQASAQDLEVTRRSYPFLEKALEVAVVTEVPGEVEVVRGSRGRLEVSARSTDGFPGFALGGHLTPRLRLTAVGSNSVQYLVVVPEHVNVRIQLPDGTSASLPSGAPSAAYSWGGPPVRGLMNGRAPAMNGRAPAMNGRSSDLDMYALEQAAAPTGNGHGLYIVHATPILPTVVDVPDLASVRSLSVRFEGENFRVAASRPLKVEPGDAARLELRIAGDPLDLVLYAPRDAGPFSIRAAGSRIAQSAAGDPVALCGNVIVQRPSDHQVWLTFRPQSGRLDCP